MRFVIQINHAPFQAQAVQTGYQFCAALLRQGQQLERIFFYQEGIYNALASCTPQADDVNPVGLWSQLAARNNIDLLVCISAAQKRGLLLEKTEQSPALADGFRIGGLGEMVEAMINAERFLAF